MSTLLRALHERRPLPAALAHYQSLAAQAELQRLQGKGLIPEPGCLFARLPLGEAAVTVEYRVRPGSAGTWDEPAEPDQIELCSVLINGRMVDASLFAPHILDQWLGAIASDRED
jgi:hypothetical protein